MGDTEGIPLLALGNTLWLRGTGPRGCLPAVSGPALTHNPILLHPGGVVISRWSDRCRHVAGPGSESNDRQRLHDTVLRIVLVGRIPRDKVKEIAELKMSDLNAADIEGAMKIIAGTARSMGIDIEE